MNKRNPSTVRGLLAAATLLALAGAAQAQAGGYMLIGGGRSDYKADCSGTTSCDNSGNALKIAGGYRFGSGWAAEGLYLNFGKSSATFGATAVELKATALGGGAAFFADLGPNWGFTGRLGLASVKLKGRARLGTLVGNVSDSSANLYAGLGVNYNFTPNAGLELGFLRTNAEFEGEKGNITAFTLSARFTF
jgi:OOP family OmpA-OmpF porin